MRRLLIALATGLVAGPVMAQVDPKIHKLCSEAKDYAGCVNTNITKDADLLKGAKKGNGTPQSPDWRSYGPLQVNWSGLQRMGGSFVAPILNSDGKPVYLTVNCEDRKFNTTSESGQWKNEWNSPQSDFEQRLVTDLCNASPPSASRANERPAVGASVATWQDYCNSQGKTYYERTSGLSWFGIKLSSKKEWQGCLTDAEAAQSGAGGTTYTPVNPRPPVNCYGSGYATGANSYNTKTTCY